jgi:hypothetical protein
VAPTAQTSDADVPQTPPRNHVVPRLLLEKLVDQVVPL